MGGFDSGYSAINLVTYVYQNVKKKDKNLFKNIFRKKTKKLGVFLLICVKVYFHYIKETHLGTCLVSSSFPQLPIKPLLPLAAGPCHMSGDKHAFSLEEAGGGRMSSDLNGVHPE